MKRLCMDLPKIISLLHRKMNMELNVRLSEIDLSDGKSRLLKLLIENEEMAQGDLVRELGLDKSTVAKALDRMKDKELIVKLPNPEDTRSFIVRPTDKAIKLYPQIREVMENWSDDITIGMSEEDKESFFRLINTAALAAAEVAAKNSPWE